MTSFWRRTRAQLITPDLVETTMDRRGFHVKDDAGRQRLETVGARFLEGFRYALESAGVAEAAARLETVDRMYRGFAYEGATMGYAVLDGLTPVGGRRTERFMAGPAAPHVYMAYVGIGWAYARLPRLRWGAVPTPDRLLRWLVLDGYGFYHAFFNTDRVVHRQLRPGARRWPADVPGDYWRRVVDQGIGRAMWFVAGADPDVANTLISRFDPARHGDLWSGMGLAATYAGGATEAELKTLHHHAGRHQPHLAQGAAFAAQARLFAGLLAPHNTTATSIFCGRTPEDAAEVTVVERVALPEDGALPAYEVWRRRIQTALA
jgi:enediyne biosynthesis protein E3